MSSGSVAPPARATSTPRMSNAVLYVKPSPGWWSSGIPPRIAIHSSGGGTRCGCGGPCRSRSTRSWATGAEKSDGKPCPFVDVSRCRSVIGRLAGTVSSTGPVIERTTTGAASSGNSSPTGWSSSRVPSATNVRASAATIGLVIEAMRNSASSAIGRPSTAASPSTTTSSWSPRPTAATSPGTSRESTSGRSASARAGHRTSLAHLPQDPPLPPNARRPRPRPPAPTPSTGLTDGRAPFCAGDIARAVGGPG